LIKCPPAELDRAIAECRKLDPPSAVKLKLHVDPYDFF
jgi:hypothetical protein